MNLLTATNTQTLGEYIIIQRYLNIQTPRVPCGKDGFTRTGAIKHTHVIIHYSLVPGMKRCKGIRPLCVCARSFGVKKQ